MKPPESIIQLALRTAAQSPCRSKRGVVCYVAGEAVESIAGIVGIGSNGPAGGWPCPGRAICAGTCGQRSVHAEMRALRNSPPEELQVELVHVELAPDGGVVACDGPGCWQCSREILDVGFVAGVWLYQTHKSTRDLFIGSIASGAVQYEAHGVYVGEPPRRRIECLPQWVRYTATEFHRVTLQRRGMTP